MSIIAAFKKAKKAAEEHKAAVAIETEAEAEAPPPPYKHVPTHAARDALAFAPMAWSTEETQSRIAAARRKRSETISSAPIPPPRSAYHTYGHSRSKSDLTHSTRPVPRGPSDLSIESVMQKQRPVTFVTNPPPPNPQPLFTHHDYSLYLSDEDIRGFSQPRCAPPPPPPRRPLPPLPISGRPFETKKKSPLSIVTTEEAPEPEEEAISLPESPPSVQSVQTTQSTWSSTRSSIASSQSSHEETPPPRRSGSSQSRKKLSKAPNLKSNNNNNASNAKPKRQSITDISRPYTSDDKTNNIFQPNNTATSTIPTWRYEDLNTETKPPELVRSLGDTVKPHVRKTSRSISIFQGLGTSISVS